MTLTIPTDPHELAWLTKSAIKLHCSVNAHGRSTIGFSIWGESTVGNLLAETNHSKFGTYSGTLLPLLGALSAMDQFGACYQPNPSTFPVNYGSKSGIIKSAHNFLSIPVDTPDSNALYALRNALMHQSSLISVGRKPNSHYWFEIDNNISTLFAHPTTAWDGQFNTRSSTNRTLVNASKILELALKLPKILVDAQEHGKLQLVLPGGLEELLTNYVTIDFDGPFRAAYLTFVGGMIHRSLSARNGGDQDAKKALDGVSKHVIEEAVRLLGDKVSGSNLHDLIQAYPAAFK